MSSIPTQTSAPATASSNAANSLVRHFPADVREAYARYQTSHSAADADIVILAVVQDHVPDKKNTGTTTLGDRAKLIQDLGFDSVAVAELVFFLEDLFHVQIRNEEIMQVSTVGDLRSFVRLKIAANSPSVTA